MTGFAVLALTATAAAQSSPARPHASSWRVPALHGAGDRWEINDLRGSGPLDTPVAIDLRFAGGTFRLDTGARERARANLTAMRGDNRVRLSHTTITHGDEPHIAVHLAMPSSAVALDSLPTLVQGSWAGATSSHFDFTVPRD